MGLDAIIFGRIGTAIGGVRTGLRLARFVWILARREPCAVTGGRNANMLKRFFLTIVGATFSFAVIAVPAQAADEIEVKVQACAACHGQNGVPVDPKTIPIIWGQQLSYLVKQLHDYRSGDRENPIMSPIAKSLVQEDLRKIAAYFATKGWPAQQASAASASLPNGIAQCQPC